LDDLADDGVFVILEPGGEHNKATVRKLTFGQGEYGAGRGTPAPTSPKETRDEGRGKIGTQVGAKSNQGRGVGAPTPNHFSPTTSLQSNRSSALAGTNLLAQTEEEVRSRGAANLDSGAGHLSDDTAPSAAGFSNNPGRPEMSDDEIINGFKFFGLDCGPYMLKKQSRKWCIDLLTHGHDLIEQKSKEDASHILKAFCRNPKTWHHYDYLDDDFLDKTENGNARPENPLATRAEQKNPKPEDGKYISVTLEGENKRIYERDLVILPTDDVAVEVIRQDTGETLLVDRTYLRPA
jgi:hypothetical protein